MSTVFAIASLVFVEGTTASASFVSRLLTVAVSTLLISYLLLHRSGSRI